MIPLSHPLVQDYLRAARERGADGTLARIMLNDRMQDAGVHGGIGTPGGLDLATCCWWYAHSGDEDEAALREALATVDELLGGRERAAQVRGITLNYQWDDMSAGPWEIRSAPDGQGEVTILQHAWGLRKTAMLCVRRRVLGLYPEVRVIDRRLIFSATEVREQRDFDNIIREAQARMKAEGWADWAEIHCRYDEEARRVVYSQTLTAPQLIRPEQALNPAAFQGPFDAEMDEHLARTLRRTRMIEWATRTTDR